MTHAKIICRTNTTTRDKRRARRLSRTFVTPIIIFRNEDDWEGEHPHYRTLHTFCTNKCSRSVLYWNWGEIPNDHFAENRHGQGKNSLEYKGTPYDGVFDEDFVEVIED